MGGAKTQVCFTLQISRFTRYPQLRPTTSVKTESDKTSGVLTVSIIWDNTT